MVSVNAIALSGLRASEQRLGVAADNIANANTPDFRAKQVQQTSVVSGGVATRVVDAQPATITVANNQGTQNLPNVSTEQQLIEAKTASYDFKANLKVLEVQAKLQKSLLDIQA
jgi:flagellar basal body rod protein FlgC